MKFSQSTYNRIFTSAEGRAIVTQILANPDLISAKHTFWRNHFKVDGSITPTSPEGEAVFISRMKKMQAGTLMDMRAPLGNPLPEDKLGIEFYTGAIPQYSTKDTTETAMERDYKEQLFSQFGDASLIAQYATEVLQGKVDSVNQTLSHMGAQLLSTGYITYSQGQGIQSNVLKANIPTANFLKAGAKVWTDSTARLLDQMRKIESDVKESTGLNIAYQWNISRDMFINCFLPNAQVIEQYRYIKSLNNVLLPTTVQLTVEMALEAISFFEGISPIVLIEEKQNDTINGVVHGWATGKAVLRPAGYAGLIRKAVPKDVDLFAKYGNKVNTYSVTPILSGVAYLINSEVMNGDFKEWHTYALSAAVPSLDEFLYHYIIDTTTANS